MREAVSYDNLDMITIHVPQRIDRALRRDAEYFEVFKKGGEVNYRGFLSMLLIGYHKQYHDEVTRKADMIRECVDKEVLNPAQAGRLSKELMKLDFSKEAGKAEKQKSVQVSLRPRNDTAGIINQINEMLPKEESLSSYFCDMFTAYCSKPIYERERIIFFDSAEKIADACGKKKAGLSFALKSHPADFHYVIPYEFVYGSDEQYNYLLCQEWNEEAGKYEAGSYRLCRIVEPRLDRSMDTTMDEGVVRHLEMMKTYGPQYQINEDVESCVRLTEKGRKSFRVIYQGRPVRVKKASKENEPNADGTVDYFFECSQEQLYFYFRRFNPGEAEVVYPESLKEELRKFHKEHLDAMG